jgi:HEAT repeat protein
MSEIDRIQKLLESDSIETRIAAAIVLGELRVKQPSVSQALVKVLESPVPVLQRHALEALTQIGNAKKATKRAFELLTSNVDEVRRAAQVAITSIGEEVVPTIRERMPHALPEERRALDAILAELGGKDAFTTLLSGLASSEGEAAKGAALAVRQHVRESGARERKSYLAETEKFLQGLEPKKQKLKKGEAPPPVDPKQIQAKAAAIKILGYLEDERAIPTLMAYATDESQPAVVRQEAFIGLRFAIGSGKTPAKLIDGLIDAAEGSDRMLAQTALHTLGGLELPAAAAKRLEKLAMHPDVGRVQFVIEHLGRLGTPDAVRALVNIVCTADRRRAEIAAGVLGGKEDAIAPLGKALLETKDPDRAWMIRNVLRPTAKKLGSAVRKQLLDEAMDRLGDGSRGWEALLDVVRDADPTAVADALRSLATKLKKTNPDKAMTVLALLCRSDKATDADRYALASLELQKGSRDTRPVARAGDPALQKLASLLGRGFDVGSALRKDRAVDLDHLYYVGFHFAEEGHPIGEELLGEVVKKGGRSKVAKMAKNKLALATS